MKNIFEDFKMIEPLKKNRFLIHFENVDIPSTLFRDFEVYNQGEDIVFETSIDRKSTRLNSSHVKRSRMPSSA